MARVEVEGVEGPRLESALAWGKLKFHKDLGDARDERGLENLAASGVARYLTYHALRVDDPADHEIALYPRMGAERLVVASPRLVAVCDDNGSDVRGAATRIMGARTQPPRVDVGLRSR
jgi:hypothetical protein